jgi:hypothetical protein
VHGLHFLEEKWSKSIAVGSRDFIDSIKEKRLFGNVSEKPFLVCFASKC